MSLEINKLNGVNPFEKSGGIQAATQETKINSVFTHANQTSAAEGTAQNGENAYFTDAVQNGNVSLKKGFLNFGNSYNFKVGDDETLAKFSQKMGLSPEMVMDNIILLEKSVNSEIILSFKKEGDSFKNTVRAYLSPIFI